jgi:hydrogenase small subunit
MSTTMYWISCGSCGGDTISFLNAASPGITELFQDFDIELLWHPSLTVNSADDHRTMVREIVSGNRPLDLFCIEGAIIHGPDGTGMFDQSLGRAKKEMVRQLAEKASYVLAVGTCAAFGGIGSKREIEGSGVQFCGWEKGGLLGADFTSRSGLPVINLPGCPCHSEVIGGTIMTILTQGPFPLTDHNMPEEWFGTLVHQGCTRNEYHEYRVEEEGFGERGCLFFHLGCHGPLAYGPCNKTLWNQRSSKTRVGVPCFGCTRPDFPQDYPFYQTRNIEGIPLELPDGIDRAHYMAYKGLAAAAAPERLIERKTKI